jgi:hypothetical protein
MGRGPPEPQGIDGLAAEADNRSVERDADQRRGAAGNQFHFAPVHLERATELDLHGFAGTSHLPRILMVQPVVRIFALPAVLDRLPEHAVLVAQAIARRRQLHRSHRIEEAGGEPSEAAVAQAGIGFLLDQPEPVEAGLARGRFDIAIQQQIGDVVGQRTADQEFH